MSLPVPNLHKMQAPDLGLRHSFNIYFVYGGGREMAEWLRALAVLLDNLNSVLSTHNAVHNCPLLQLPGI